jgi:hypothetical protein
MFADERRIKQQPGLVPRGLRCLGHVFEDAAKEALANSNMQNATLAYVSGCRILTEFNRPNMANVS